MNKTLLSLLLLLCTPTLFAQTGTFTVSRSGNVLTLTGSDPAQKYQTIVLRFDRTVDEDQTITFLDASGTFPLPGVASRLGSLTNDSILVIGLSPDEKNYVVSTTASPAIPEQFRFAVGNATTSVPLNVKPVPVIVSAKASAYNTGSFDDSYEPGYVLYDAMFIADSMHRSKGADSTILAILAFYGIKDRVALAQNAYLNEELRYLYPMVQGRFSIESLTGTPLSGLLSSVGNLDVTALADGFARFIVDRTKQELNIAFFDRLKETLDDSAYIDLRTVFPQTYRVLSVIGDEIYQYDLYLEALREAFVKDLNALPTNLSTIVSNHPDFFAHHPELKATLESAFYITRELQDGQHPGNIIAGYPTGEYLDSVNPNVAASFQTMQLLSFSLRGDEPDSDRYWAPEADLKQLFKSDLTFRMYMGLLEQEAKKEGIRFRGSGGAQDSLWKIIDSSYTFYTAYRSYIKTVVANVQSLESDIEQMRTAGNDSLKLERYYGIITASIDLMEELTAVDALPGFPVKNLRQETAKYFYTTQTTADIAIEVYRKKYATAIIDAVHLYDSVFSRKNIEKAVEEQQDIASLVPRQPEGRTGDAAPGFAHKADKKKAGELEKLVNKAQKDYAAVSDALLKYGSFLSAVAKAKTPEEVETAIEAAALPAGSARIKRESAFNIALNAYCGPYVGYERIVDLDAAWLSGKNSVINSIGLTAPIGIAVSWGGNCQKAKNHSSYSVFLSVIDLGAVAAFRFNDDSTEVLPTIQLKNILSPGVFFSYGIPRTPVSLNLGWQMGPLLRKVEAEENTYEQRYSRVSLSVCVDLPVFNFYTVPRRGL